MLNAGKRKQNKLHGLDSEVSLPMDLLHKAVSILSLGSIKIRKNIIACENTSICRLNPNSEISNGKERTRDRHRKEHTFFLTHEKSFHIPVGNSFSVDIVLQPDPSTQVQQDPQA